MAAKAKEIFNDLSLVLRLNQHIEELTSNETSAAALLAKETSFKVLAELASLETPEPREEAQFDHQRAGFRGAADASDLPFHLQGDQAFNEASALARRRQLRHCEALKAKTQFLWQVARGRQATELSHGGVSTDQLHNRSSSRDAARADATIDEREYSALMMLIYKVLRDDFVHATAQEQIQCDWAVDSHHGDALSYDQFFAALFELVDVWTCDMLEATYVRFLELLTRRVTVRVVVFLDDMKLKLALSDNFDEAIVVKAIPLSTIKQFATVARVMEGTGVRTVGELAVADPRVVETQRVGYLERNAFSKDKIGAELRHLLDMFRDISGQFQDANYSLQHNRVLQRLPDGSLSSDNGDEMALGARVGAGVDGATTRMDSGRVSSCLVGSHALASGSDLCAAVELSSRKAGSGVRSTTPSTTPTSSSAHRGSSGGARSIGGFEGGAGGSSSAFGSAAEAGAALRRGGIKRINTFHDISVTETGVIDALKTTFLIEKGISIQRKTSMAAIQAELEKFGINTKDMEDAAMRSKYETLYETFVLRDGDNIKALAQSLLARIKMELAAHGIEVNAEDMEAMYDGFYGSVVAGSGDRIVADAKNWVEETVATNSHGPYIKQDYHELKSIDEVMLLGSGTEDEEFVSLLSKENEDEDEQEDDDSTDRIGTSSPSPTMKGGAHLSRRPSLYRGVSQSIEKAKGPSDTRGEESTSSTAKASLSMDAGSDRVSGEHGATGVVAAELNLEISTEHRRVQTPENDPDATSTDSFAGSEDEFAAPLTPPSDEADINSTRQANQSWDDLVVSEDPACVIQYEDCARSSPFNGGTVPGNVSGLDDDAEARRRNAGGPLLSHSKPDLLDQEDLANVGGNHSHVDELDREPQGVEFEYEEQADQPPEEMRPASPDRLATRDPKVPDIVVSGVESGKNVAVAARYIQLLGLGNVQTIVPESELMERLASPTAAASIDLICFDIGDELDSALDKSRALVSLVGRRVIFFGGDERQPDKSEVVAELCVSECGLLYFAMLPLDFPSLRGEIQTFFDASPHLYLLRQRRPTAVVFGAAAKLLTTSIRATNVISVGSDHPRSVLTPPHIVDNSSAKRKATAMLTAMAAAPLPQVVAAKREAFSPFRSLRVVDEMPGADMVLPTRFSPVVPASHAPKAHRKSPRMSATLKRFLR